MAKSTNPMTLKSVIEAYRNGDSLTDAQVKFGAENCRACADMLASTGPEFYLAFKEMNLLAYAFEGFQEARARKY